MQERGGNLWQERHDKGKGARAQETGLARVAELRERFGLACPDHVARALRISVKEAQRLLRRAKVEERQ